jgi:TRAP-type C4-dicarboxylate transport system permease small subunit
LVLIRIVESLSRLGGILAMALLAAAVLVVCQMIVVRYVLGASTVWQTEFVIYAVVAATYLGSARVLMLKGHVGVDLLPNLVGRRARFGLELVAIVTSLGFLILLTWSGWLYFREAWENGWRTDTVWAPPLWIPLAPLPIGIGLLCLQYMVELARLVHDWRRDPDRVDGPSAFGRSGGMPKR